MNVQIILTILLMAQPDHAIYISTAEVIHESGQSTSHLAVRVFSDDFEDVIRNYTEDFETGNGDWVNQNLKSIEDYFNQNLKVQINSFPIKLLLNHSERQEETHELTFSLECPKTWSLLHLEASYFSELFPDQSNVFTIREDGQKYFTRLSKTKPTDRITFR